jgi:hypothetical protein
MAVFWVVAPCSLVEVYHHHQGDECLIALMMEAARTSETLVNLVGFEVLMAVSTKMAVIALMMEAARTSETLVNLVGFEVLTAVSTKMAVIALMMEAARTSETVVNFYQTTRCYNPEDSHLLD